MMRSPRRRMGRARADTYHVGNPIPFAIELANLLLIDLERKHHLMIQFCCLGMYRGQIESPPRNRVQDAHQCALRVAIANVELHVCAPRTYFSSSSISESAAPAGTIGKTLASGAQSNTSNSGSGELRKRSISAPVSVETGNSRIASSFKRKP